jgi:GTPase-associated system helical domain
MAEFNFIEAYKGLQPTAERGLVDARSKAFSEIVANVDMPRVVDLCRLAFHLPYRAESYAEWFQNPLNGPDPQFFVAQDAAEAGRVATLALRHFVSRGSTNVASAVLAASYAGKRQAFDDGGLSTASRDLMTASSRKGGMTAPSTEIVLGATGDLTKQNTEMTTTFDAAKVGAFVGASVGDLRARSGAAVKALSDAYQALRNDNLRLAEETDMLWWHVGDWSNILDVPRMSLPKKSVGLVSGIDLGAMVKVSPGPYGAYGILKRAMGADGDKQASLIEAVDGLTAEQIGRLALSKAPDVYPVLTALRLAAAGGDWKTQFAALVRDAGDIKLTGLELATQAYRERVSMTDIGWAG